jgi:hypothetical protein
MPARRADWAYRGFDKACFEPASPSTTPSRPSSARSFDFDEKKSSNDCNWLGAWERNTERLYRLGLGVGFDKNRWPVNASGEALARRRTSGASKSQFFGSAEN